MYSIGYFVKNNSKHTCILTVTGFDKFSVSSISKICSNLSRRESSFHGSKVKMWTFGGNALARPIF